MGDSRTCDVAGAQAAGLDTCWFCPNPNIHSAPAALPIPSDGLERFYPFFSRYATGFPLSQGSHFLESHSSHKRR